MNTFDYKYEAQNWLDEARKNHLSGNAKRFSKPFIGARGYPHFDDTIRLEVHEQIERMKETLSRPDLLRSWPFFPFIKKDTRDRKFRHKPIVAIEQASTRNQKRYTHIKSRPIMYASHRDSCVYSFLGHLLNKSYEDRLDALKLGSKVIAYRSVDGKNNINFAKDAFDHINKVDDIACILIDVSNFFGTIEHKRLLSKISEVVGQKLPPEILHILNSLTHFRYINEDKAIQILRANKKPYLFRASGRARKMCKIEDFNKLINKKNVIKKNHTSKGIPQGSPISGLLANIYLLDFDASVNQLLTGQYGALYQRYSDDILIVCPIDQVERVYDDVISFVEAHGLSVSRKKTEVFEKRGDTLSNITHRLEPKLNSSRRELQYLGLHWSGNQIVLRPGTVSRRYRPKSQQLTRKFWRYHQLAGKITQQGAMRRQMQRVRRKIKQKLQTKTDNHPSS